MSRSRAVALRSRLFWVVAASCIFLAGAPSFAPAAFTVSGEVVPSNPSAWSASFTTGYVGKTSAGTLTVDGGSSLVSNYGYLGYNSGASGTVVISGVGSKWTNSKDLYVGDSGSGLLSVFNGGTIGCRNGSIGHKSGSSGTVTVDGAGSKWTNSGDLYVGDSGSGTLNISNGGVVSGSEYSSGYIGADPGSSGTVTVDGVGSALNNDGMCVGSYGSGTLNILHGGTVNGGGGTIGYDTDSSGVVTVDGAGSKWTHSSDMYVGYSGNGTLNICNGGIVSNNAEYTSACIGAEPGSLGTVTVVDAGSLWSNRDLYVGRYGTGTLRVASGGTVGCASGSIGDKSGSSGTLTVDGPGSKWTISSSLYVGDAGNGTLNISNGGTVSNSGCYLGYNSGSSGTATVDGTGSKWTNGDSLFVGYSGNAILNITNGGTVSSGDGCIGYTSGSSGTATVDGAGSTWSSSSLRVGESGSGTLNIFNGGIVTVAGKTSVTGAGSTISFGANGGTLTTNMLIAPPVGQLTGTGTIVTKGLISDFNLTFDASATASVAFGTGGTVTVNMGATSGSGDLGAGYASTGTLTIQNGASIYCHDAFLGYGAGSSGTATVRDGGSKWTNSNAVYVGYYGSGMLNITTGGTVSNSYGTIGYDTGSSGTVTVDGPGSTWTNNNTLYVGRSGNAILNITNGSAVSVGYETYVSGSTSAISFGAGGGTLTTKTLWTTKTQLTGTGTINTKGLVSDFDLTFDASPSCSTAFGTAGTLTVNMNDTYGNGDLGVGYTDAGTLVVKNAARIYSAYGYLGYNAGTSGTATVDGPGSQWTSNSDLYVGKSGNGTLNIFNGGVVSVSDITYVSGSTSTINFGVGGGTLTTGMLWALKTQLTGIGTIKTYGLVSDFDLTFDGSPVCSVAFGDGGTATVDVHSSYCFGAGYTDAASLVVKNAASIRSRYGYLGYNAGSSGTATVDGPGTKWSNDYTFYVGYYGSGRLTITNGGTVSNVGDWYGDGYIGCNSGATGTVMVDGAGSIWSNSGRLYVGASGIGTLNISNGGTVSDTSGMIGYQTGSSGTVTVDGPGSTWSNSGSLNVGNSGNGTLNVVNGGVVSSREAAIGHGTDSSGAVLVSGPGSAWVQSGKLYLGDRKGAQGTLLIAGGATVSSLQSWIGSNSTGSAAGVGVVAVEGSGSAWIHEMNFVVGYGGTGTLSISGGGMVKATQAWVASTSLLAIDVGRGSSLTIHRGYDKIINDGTVRLLAGAGVPVNDNVKYSPISAGSWDGTGTYQAVGGKWDATNHLFTASSVTSGLSGAAISLDLAAVERALVSYDGSDRTNWTVGASFVAAVSTKNITFTATGISDAVLAGLEDVAGDDQVVLSGWTFATTGYAVSSSNPIYFSLEVGPGLSAEELELWRYDGGAWTSYAPIDLTYDGMYASFTATGLSGYAATAVPEPGTVALLGVGVLGLLGCVFSMRRRGR